MTWSYNPAIGANLDRVRLYIGDTDSTDQQLQDEEVAFLLSDEGNVLRASVAAAESLAARYARQVDYQVPREMQEFASQRVEQYRSLARDLRRKASRRGAVPLAGGISVHDKTALESDPDRVQPYFNRSMETEPGTESEEPLTFSPVES